MEAAKYYRVYDKDKNHLYNLPAGELRKGVVGDDEYLQCVNIIVTQGGEVVLQVRADTQEAGGFLDIVSGKVDDDDNPDTSAIREVNEEYSVPVEVVAGHLRKLGVHTATLLKRETLKNWHMNFYHIDVPVDIEIVFDPGEIARLLRVPAGEIMEFLRENWGRIMLYNLGDVVTESYFQNVVDYVIGCAPDIN